MFVVWKSGRDKQGDGSTVPLLLPYLCFFLCLYDHVNTGKDQAKWNYAVPNHDIIIPVPEKMNHEFRSVQLMHEAENANDGDRGADQTAIF